MPPKKSPAVQALGKAFRERRRAKGYSQESFAVHSGMDRSYVAAIERGEFNISLEPSRRWRTASKRPRRRFVPRPGYDNDQRACWPLARGPRGRDTRAARQQAGYSQEAFARGIGVDRTYYQAVERGYFNVTLKTMLKIAAGLDSSVGALCTDAGI